MLPASSVEAGVLSCGTDNIGFHHRRHPATEKETERSNELAASFGYVMPG
jgi:hypothetical protein